ncbi:hypothetical protein Tco_1199926 [Tanacetum coccineum]
MSSSSSSINRNQVHSPPTHCKCGLPLARRILWTEWNPEQKDVFDDAINRFEMQITRKEMLESLEQEFASYKSKIEADLKKCQSDLKKYQSGMVQWKKLTNSMVVIIIVLLGLLFLVI